MRFKRATLAAVRAFKASRPWSGEPTERWQKFTMLHAALCEIYQLDVRLLQCGPGQDSFFWSIPTIYLDGEKMSVVTYLHEFRHAIDCCAGLQAHNAVHEYRATQWSVELFKRVFPRQFAKCEFDGQILRKRRDAS